MVRIGQRCSWCWPSIAIGRRRINVKDFAHLDWLGQAAAVERAESNAWQDAVVGKEGGGIMASGVSAVQLRRLSSR